MKILQNIDKNEKIVLKEASFAATIILLFNTVMNALPKFWDSIWNTLKIPNEIAQGLIIFVSNIITFAIIFLLIHIGHKLLWLYVINPRWNLTGTWYVIQRDNDKPKYFRIGEVIIKQNYYHINMNATTYNIIFNPKKRDDWETDESVRTKWEENMFLANNGNLLGLYTAERTNGKPHRQGFHKLELKSSSETCVKKGCDPKQQKKCKRRVRHITGQFCDVEYDTKHDARIGTIELFQNYQKYQTRVSEICTKICNIHRDVVVDGKFRSEIV
jgi:hypothetical protein